VNSSYYKKATGAQSDAVITCPTRLMTSDDLPAGAINPNPDRRPITHNQALNEFFNTSTLPKGHGLTQSCLDNDAANYTIDLPGLPVRLLFFEMVFAGDDQSGFTDKGYLYRTTVDNFLKPALDKAKADSVLVIAASHHQSWGLANGSEVKAAELTALLASYPNVVLHLVGHGHENKIMAHPSGKSDGTGYWEVETPSLTDYPQQARLVEMADEGDGTGSIYLTCIDHNSAEGTVMWKSREYSIYHVQAGYNTDPGQGTVADRNVRLRFQMPDSVKSALSALPAKDVESLNFGK
jgi:hypothetical protein